MACLGDVITRETLGRVWQLGLALARANQGQLITAVLVTHTDVATVDVARQVLASTHEMMVADDKSYPLIVHAITYEKGLVELVNAAQADLLLAHGDGPAHFNLNKAPCAIGVLRGEKAVSPVNNDTIQRILLPTSGGPHTVYGLNTLLPLTPEIEVTALWVTADYLGQNEDALGHARLRQVLNFIDAGERIQTKYVTADTVTHGILDEASNDYDLVILGASNESSIDQVLFGNIPGAIVRECGKPVLIIRQPQSRVSQMLGQLAWHLQTLIPRMSLSDRTDAYVRIRRSARPQHRFLHPHRPFCHDCFIGATCKQSRRCDWGYVGCAPHVAHCGYGIGGCVGRCSLLALGFRSRGAGCGTGNWRRSFGWIIASE